MVGREIRVVGPLALDEVEALMEIALIACEEQSTTLLVYRILGIPTVEIWTIRDATSNNAVNAIVVKGLIARVGLADMSTQWTYRLI